MQIKVSPSIITLKSVVAEVMEDQRLRREDPNYFYGWRWHIPRLNEIVGPIQPGWWIGVSAKAKAGKTSFLLTAAMDLARQGAKVLWIGLEEGENETFIRMAANASGVSRREFRGETGMSDKDWNELIDSIPAIEDLSIVFSTAYTLGETRDVAEKADVDFILIDYLQLMEPENPQDSRVLELSQISRGLKQLARGDDYHRKRITMVNIQLNDDGKTLWSRDPTRDCDILMSLTELVDTAGNILPNKVSLRIVVSRHSGAGDEVVCYMNGARSLVAEISEVTVNLDDMLDRALNQYMDV